MTTDTKPTKTSTEGMSQREAMRWYLDQPEGTKVQPMRDGRPWGDAFDQSVDGFACGIALGYIYRIAPKPAAPERVWISPKHGGWFADDGPMADDAQPYVPEAMVPKVPEHVRKLIGRIDRFRACMSYNDSYFGEPAGLLKGVFAELAREVNPIYPSGKTAILDGDSHE